MARATIRIPRFPTIRLPTISKPRLPSFSVKNSPKGFTAKKAPHVAKRPMLNKGSGPGKTGPAPKKGVEPRTAGIASKKGTSPRASVSTGGKVVKEAKVTSQVGKSRSSPRAQPKPRPQQKSSVETKTKNVSQKSHATSLFSDLFNINVLPYMVGAKNKKRYDSPKVQTSSSSP